MSRMRYFDFRTPDSTLYFNQWHRAMIKSGVYLGFNVSVGGSGGLWLKFTHDVDPDNTGKVLGSLMTHDGVVITEDATQDNVCVGSLSAGTPNIHYVIASYAYNRALPANDVVYSVKQGTSGSPPTPPTLTDDEVKLAEIYVPLGSVGYGSAGVKIKNVAKLDMYALAGLFSSLSPKVIDPGIYSGMQMVVGSTNMKITVKAGAWGTKEGTLITEAADLSDKFTQTTLGSNTYRLAWFVGMHKHENTSPEQAVDYLLVEGTAVGLTASASLPSDSAILSAAAAIDPKYTSANYINKLGYVRIANRAGTYEINYYKGETVLDPETVVVYGAEDDDLGRSGKYYGHVGLLQAIEDIYAITVLDANLKKPHKLQIDGEIKLASSGPLYLPSNLRLEAHGAGARIVGEGDVVSIVGFDVEFDLVNPTVAQAAGSSSPPPGYVARNLTIQSTYRVGDDLVARKFCAGDRIELYSDAYSTAYKGWISQYITAVDNWTVEVIVEDQYNTDGNPTDLYLSYFHRGTEMEGIEIDSIGSGTGKLTISHVDNGFFNKIRCKTLSKGHTTDTTFGLIEVVSSLSAWNNLIASVSAARGNKYEQLLFRCPVAQLDIGAWETADVGLIRYENLANVIDFRVHFSSGHIGSIRCSGAAGSILRFSGVSRAVVGYACCDGTDHDIILGSTTQSFIAEAVATRNLKIESGCSNNQIGFANATSITDTSGDPTNRILSTYYPQSLAQFLDHPNSDRNLKMVSDGNVAWNATTGLLSWDASILFDNPWQTGYSSVAAGSATLSASGDRLYADINRDASGTSVVTVAVRDKANATLDMYFKNRVFLAIRYGTTVYLWDGTRIETGQRVKIGQTPPPVGSVTWDAFAADALEFHHRFYRNFVDSEQSDTDFENAFLLQNAGTFSYTDATGVVQYASSVDLSTVRPGDVILLINVDYDPTSGSNRAFNREPIISVDDANNRVTISAGLGSFTIGSASRWNGSIARGNKVTYNNPSSPIGFTYAPAGTNPGRVTFGGNFSFSQYQVRRGYVFVDSAGQKFPILSFDTSGNGAYVDIPPGLTNVNTSTPTTYDHGSIETNSNPYGTPLAEMRTVCGWEFVPVQNIGNRIKGINDHLSMGAWPTSFGTWGEPSPMHPIPHDKRIVLRGGDTWPIITQVPMAASVSPGEAYYCSNPDVDWAEFTGVCTGVLPVFSHGGSSTTTPHLDIYIDGEQIQNAISCTETDVDAAFGQAHAIYRVAGGGEGKSGRLRRLGYGVHHIRFEVVANGGFRGFIVINHLQDGTKEPKTWSTPGSALIHGKYRTFGNASAADAVPITPPSGWEKGSRHIRYVDQHGAYKWASNYITNFTTSGNVSNGSADILLVSDPSKWRIGDLVMFIQVGSKYLRRIINIVGATITLNTTMSYSQSGATMYYYGRSFNAQSGALSIKGPRWRDNEDLAIKLPATEFAAPGPVINNRGTAADYSYTSSGGLRTSDLCTGFSCAANTQRHCAINLVNTSQMAKIIFIGTGISMQADTTAGVTIKLDGINLGTWVVASNSWDSEGGQFVVGDLPYGVHMLEIDYIGNSLSIAGFTVFQPKRPVIAAGDQPALELWESNALCASETSLSASTDDGPENYPIGCITYDIRYAHPGGVNNVFREFSLGIPDLSLHNIEFDWLSGGGSNGFWIDLPFFGDEIQLVYNTVSLGGGAGTIVVEILDHDGVFKAPGSTTGFVSTGITAFVAASANCLRQRWTMSELGFHILRIRSTAASNYIDMEAVEVHTPFHMYKTQPPMLLDHLVPFANAGLDIRPRTPFRSVDVPSGNFVHVVGAEAHTSAAILVQNMYPFVFYSFGGPVKLSASFNFDDPAAAGFWTQISVDGSAQVGYASADVPAAGDVARLSMSVVFYAPAGLHVAWIECSDPATYEIGSVTWTAEAYEAAPEGLRSRTNKLGASLGTAHIGDL